MPGGLPIGSANLDSIEVATRMSRLCRFDNFDVLLVPPNLECKRVAGLP